MGRRPWSRRPGIYVCSPSAAEIWREMTSDGAGSTAELGVPITRCTHERDEHAGL